MLIYVHRSLRCNLRNDLYVADKDKKTITVEISRKNDKSILLSCCYKTLNGDNENLIGFLQNKIKEKSVSEKKIS